MTTLKSVMDTCGGDVFAFLTVRDTTRSAASSRGFGRWSQREIGRRSKAWLAGTSRSWAWYDRNLPDGSDHFVSADDLPDNKEALGCLDDAWEDFDSPSHLLATVAAWCGGWPRLLDAREGGARSQPVIARGRPVHFTTIGDDSSRRIVLMFDIHRDGTSVWNAVHPLNESEVGCFVLDDNGDDVDVSIVHPISSKTLGDATDAATIHPFSHDLKSTRYLLSTDVNDATTWRFDVSMVSQNCSETLIHSYSTVLAAQKIVIDACDGWESNSGYHQIVSSRESSERLLEENGNNLKDWYVMMQKEYDSIAPEPNLFRCSDVHHVTQAYAPPLKGVDMEGNVTELSDSVYFEFVYWLDKRNTTNNKLHLTFDLCCPDSMFSDMIVHHQMAHTTVPSNTSTTKRRRDGTDTLARANI